MLTLQSYYWSLDTQQLYAKCIQSLFISKCKSVRKPDAKLPEFPVALTSASKYFQMLPDPPGDLQCASKFCKSIHRYSRKWMQSWMCMQNATRLTITMVKHWSRCEQCAGLWQCSRAAETSAQALQETWCHTLTPLVLSISQPPGISFFIFVFVSVTRFATTQYGMYYISLAIYTHPEIQG